MASESGVNLIKKKVATLKSELDDVQSRAAEAEEQLAEKEVIIEKVGVLVFYSNSWTVIRHILFLFSWFICERHRLRDQTYKTHSLHNYYIIIM